MSWLMRRWKPGYLEAPALMESSLQPGLPLARKPGPWEVTKLSPNTLPGRKSRGRVCLSRGKGLPRRALLRKANLLMFH